MSATAVIVFWTRRFRRAWNEARFATGKGRPHEFLICKIEGNIRRWVDPKKCRDQVVLSRLCTGCTRAPHDFDGHGHFLQICTLYRIHNLMEEVVCH